MRTTPSAATASLPPAAGHAPGRFEIVPFAHPQGCRSYLVADPASRNALVVDPHLDLVEAIAARAAQQQLAIRFVVDTHTHADHPSGSAALAGRTGAVRVAHELARHQGVTRHPRDGEELHLGDRTVRVLHAPGHTQDHLVLVAGDALFSGDTLLIGAVARTDFLGGDAGTLFDTLERLLRELPPGTRLFPGHDYAGRIECTLAAERDANPWLAIRERAAFVRELTAGAPPRPTNMDALLVLNRDGVEPPASVHAAQLAGSLGEHAARLLDVRTAAEYESEHVPGSLLVPLDQLRRRADEVRALAAPRLLLCRTGSRAAQAREELAALGIGALTVVEGGLEALMAAGYEPVRGRKHLSLERQVRIAAGALVLAGVALGTWVHPALYGLAAFVGAGLVFAGATDWCGMGLLLARMPWNRVATASRAPAGGGCAATPSASPTASCPVGPRN